MVGDYQAGAGVGSEVYGTKQAIGIKPYEDAMNQLDKEIAVLEDTLIGLANKLQPILRGQSETVAKDSADPTDSSPLILGLKAFRRRVAEANNKIRQLGENAEL